MPLSYTIPLILPLDIEAQAVWYMLDNVHVGKVPINRGDDYKCSPGDVHGHNIVIAAVPLGHDYGLVAAAAQQLPE